MIVVVDSLTSPKHSIIIFSNKDDNIHKSEALITKYKRTIVEWQILISEY